MSDTFRQLLRAVAIVGIAASLGSEPAPAQSHSTGAAELDLVEALVRFQEAWGVDLIYDIRHLGGKYTAWTYPVGSSATQDLTTLLDRTGLVWFRLPSGTLSIRPRRNVYARLRGNVIDASLGTTMPGATVRIMETSDSVASDELPTDSDGRFLFLRRYPGEYLVQVSYLGYRTQEQKVVIWPDSSVNVEFKMEVQPINLEPLIVLGDAHLREMELPFRDIMLADDVTRISGMGTADIIRNINDIAGVRVSEVSSDLHIQGGKAGETQFLLDGSPIYEPVHSFGFTGAFNANAIGRVSVDKAGFGAAKGSYLAGVINAEHAVQDENTLPVDMLFDPMNINARVNAAFTVRGRTRVEFLGAFRKSIWENWWSTIRSGSIDNLLQSWNNPDVFLLQASLYPVKALNPIYYDILINRLSKVPAADIPFIDYTDLHLASRIQFKRHHSLNASFYLGDNKMHGRQLIAAVAEEVEDQATTDPDRYDWTNSNGQLTWTYLATDKAVVKTQMRGSHYSLRHTYAGLDRQNAELIPRGLFFLGERLFIDAAPTDDGNRITEVVLESSAEIDHDAGTLLAGFESINTWHSFRIPTIFPRTISHTRASHRLALHVEEELDLNRSLMVTAGSRFTYLASSGKWYLEPRFSAQWKVFLGDRLRFNVRGATGVYSQFLNQFDVSTISPSTLVPSTRFWMPVDGSLPPPKAFHHSLRVSVQMLPNWSIRFERYVKDQRRLYRIDYPTLWVADTEETLDERVQYIQTQAGFIALAKGFAWGNAYILARNTQALKTSVRYEYSVAEREYGFRDSVRVMPVPWSEPHRLEFALDWKPHAHLLLSARWRGGWGRIWGFRQPYYDLLATDVRQGLRFGVHEFRDPTRRAHRLDPFKRFDVGLAYSRPVGGTELRLRIDVLNVTNRLNEADRNLYEATPIHDETGPTVILTETRYLLGRTWSISLRVQCCDPR